MVDRRRSGLASRSPSGSFDSAARWTPRRSRARCSGPTSRMSHRIDSTSAIAGTAGGTRTCTARTGRCRGRRPRARASSEHGDEHGADVAEVAGDEDAHDGISLSDVELGAVERLGAAAGGAALDAAQPEQRPDRCPRVEPAAALLAREAVEDRPTLRSAAASSSAHEHVRPAEVAVVLRDLVLEDQAVAEAPARRARASEPVVLVGVAAPGARTTSGSDVGVSRRATPWAPRRVRQVAVAEAGQVRTSTLAGAREQGAGDAALCLGGRVLGAAEAMTQRTATPGRSATSRSDGAAGADLDVVGVGAEREQPRRPVGRRPIRSDGITARRPPPCASHGAQGGRPDSPRPRGGSRRAACPWAPRIRHSGSASSWPSAIRRRNGSSTSSSPGLM